MDLKNLKMPNLKKIDKKLMARIILVTTIIFVVVIAIIIIKLIIGNRMGYDRIEDKMIEAAKEYFSDDEKGIQKFKKIGEQEITVTTDTLIDAGYLKNLDKLVPNKEVECKGKVVVKMNNNYPLYSPYLDCKDAYKSKTLAEIVTADVVENGSGLYKVGEEYVFRGEFVNNYVEFADKTWLILRVRENGNIRMIETTRREKIVWDDRYNLEITANTGINDFNVSRIKDYLIALYENDEEFTDYDRSYIAPSNLCIGKRSKDETINDGSVECSTVVENWLIGLIQANEFAIPSLDANCRKITDRSCNNYNYLTSLYSSYWSITPGSEHTDKVYRLNPDPYAASAASSASVRAVVEIDGNSIYVKGDGTEDNPYIFK